MREPLPLTTENWTTAGSEFFQRERERLMRLAGCLPHAHLTGPTCGYVYRCPDIPEKGRHLKQLEALNARPSGVTSCLLKRISFDNTFNCTAAYGE
jgi:hypothetical protein